jgi:hypothetical protein
MLENGRDGWMCTKKWWERLMGNCNLMIRYFAHTEIDREKWDRCIENSCFETIYPCSWYLDLVSPGWEGLVMDDYKAVFPITWKKKYGINYVVQPVLAQQLGVFSTIKLSGAAVQSFLNLIPEKFKHIDICLNSSNEIQGKEFKIYKRINYELNTEKDTDDPEPGYSTNTKRNIKRAVQNQLAIKSADVEAYIQLRRESDKAGFKPEHYTWLEKLFSGIIKQGRGEITGAFDNDKLCAAVFWAFSKTRVIYLNASSNETGKDKRAMFLLVDHCIRKNAGKKAVMDFEGSMIPGIARFFKGFGAEEMNYYRIIKSSFPLSLKKVIK